jgi:hypothetical protein
MGIKAAEGKWIIFCDSDDMPLFLNLLTSIINANNQCDIVIGSFVTEDRLGIQSLSSLIERDTTFNWESISLNPGLWRWLIQKKLLEHISFPNLSIGEDQFFLMRLMSTTSQIQFSSLIFYVYRSEIEGRQNPDRRQVYVKLDNPEPLFVHDESILLDGKIIGHVTSGAYGHTIGGACGLGYIPADVPAGSNFMADCAGTLVPATISDEPFYDPTNARLKA